MSGVRQLTTGLSQVEFWVLAFALHGEFDEIAHGDSRFALLSLTGSLAGNHFR